MWLKTSLARWEAALRSAIGLEPDGSDALPEPVFQGAGGQTVPAAGTCAAPGRPFLVGAEQRTAPLMERSDWALPEIEPRLVGLDDEGRVRLADAWAQMARMEHASIAAFARFLLQLLNAGAPAELVEAAASALADETRHARLCFAAASHYAGGPIGPGVLDVSGSLDEPGLANALLTALREGCVDETVAAIEAAEAAAHAEDPVIRAMLERISTDETRHAELAWRFAAWALRRVDPALGRRMLQDVFEPAARRGRLANAPQPTAADREWLALGVLPPTLRPSIRQRALDRVILPCASALLGRPPVAPLADSSLTS